MNSLLPYQSVKINSIHQQIVPKVLTPIYLKPKIICLHHLARQQRKEINSTHSRCYFHLVIQNEHAQTKETKLCLLSTMVSMMIIQFLSLLEN
jgi:hypothetical protein